MPTPGPGEVLVEVWAAGVCLSDVHLIDGSISPAFPVDAVAKTCTVTLGHEVAGVIHAVGPEVAGGWKPGTRAVLQAGGVRRMWRLSASHLVSAAADARCGP